MSEIVELFAELLKDITYEELMQIKAEAEEEARREIEEIKGVDDETIGR